MTQPYMSMNKSYFSTVGLTDSYLQRNWTHWPCKGGTYWTHNPKQDFTFQGRNTLHPHTTLCEQLRRMSVSRWGSN